MLPATWIRTLVPNQQSGEISLQTGVTNHAATPVSGILSGVIMPGNVRFSQPIELDAGQTQTFEFEPRAVRAVGDCQSEIVVAQRLWRAQFV